MTQQVVPDTATDPDAEANLADAPVDPAVIKLTPAVIKPTPLPWRELSVVLVIVISEGMPLRDFFSVRR